MEPVHKFNIANLFPNEDGSKPYIGGKLDVNTLFKKKTDDEIIMNFDSRSLLKTTHLQRKKLHKWHIKMFNTCSHKITQANALGITDIIFEVINFIPECPEYKPLECIKFIESKLNEQHINTWIVDTTKIFITWADLELKLSSHEEIQ
jgi:hypothetical protein